MKLSRNNAGNAPTVYVVNIRISHVGRAYRYLFYKEHRIGKEHLHLWHEIT